MNVPLVRPDLGDAEIEAVTRVVRSGWVTQGPEVAAFEREFAAAVGAAHAVAVSNCTVALELALRVVGVKGGDEVVTVSHSFIATANAVVAVGARPVFVDVEADTLGMDPRALEDALTPQTKAILCVHQLGIPCDLDAILRLARDRGLPVIEDAACAVGSAVQRDGRWERVGRPHGDLACFSFHPRKVVTTGDGGMMTTSDAQVADRLRRLRQHAMSVPDTVRHTSSRVVFEEYSEPAYNYRMTDLQAALGRPQIARLDAIVAERTRLAETYAAALADHPVLRAPLPRPNARWNWQTYAAFLRDDARLGQVDVLQFLLDRGIACKRGVGNAHQEPAYADRSRWRSGPGGLAVSELLRDHTVMLPLYHGMTPAEQDAVIAALRELAERGRP
jgi:perosamine synthetase